MSARFGLFEFDERSGTLTREGIPVRLQPQPARVLTLLVERAGTVVSREELKAAVWGEATFVDFERGLNFCIAQIRSALGDSAESPRFIETVPRRGYRFIAPVQLPKTPVAEQDEVEPRQPTAPSYTGRSRTVWLTAGALAVVVVVATAAAVFRDKRRRGADPRRRRAFRQRNRVHGIRPHCRRRR